MLYIVKCHVLIKLEHVAWHLEKVVKLLSHLLVGVNEGSKLVTHCYIPLLNDAHKFSATEVQ